MSRKPVLWSGGETINVNSDHGTTPSDAYLSVNFYFELLIPFSAIFNGLQLLVKMYQGRQYTSLKMGTTLLPRIFLPHCRSSSFKFLSAQRSHRRTLRWSCDCFTRLQRSLWLEFDRISRLLLEFFWRTKTPASRQRHSSIMVIRLPIPYVWKVSCFLPIKSLLGKFRPETHPRRHQSWCGGSSYLHRILVDIHLQLSEIQAGITLTRLEELNEGSDGDGS